MNPVFALGLVGLILSTLLGIGILIRVGARKSVPRSLVIGVGLLFLVSAATTVLVKGVDMPPGEESEYSNP